MTSVTFCIMSSLVPQSPGKHGRNFKDLNIHHF